MTIKPKTCRRAVLAGALGVAGMLVSPLRAATPPAASRLDPVLVTASPVDSLASQAMRSVDVISAADIAAAPATTLAELLEQVPGVSIHQRGAPGVQADVGIRGSNFEQTLVLVDGMPVHNPQAGHHNLDVPVPLAHIARIEIIKGPGALAYGGSTTGGVINIITRDPQRFEAGVSGMLGSHGTRQAQAHVGGRSGRVSQLLSADVMHSDGEHRDRPTDAAIRRALYTGSADLDRWRLQWGLGASSKDFGAWGFYSDAYPDARERTATRQAWGGARYTLGNWQWRGDVYWHRHTDRFMTRIGDGEFVNRHVTNVFGILGDTRRVDAHGVTAMGTNLRRAIIDSNALSDHHRDQASLWLMRRQDLGRDWRLELGMNHVHYSGQGSYWLPSAALSWQFASQWHAFASAARSARVPSYTELFLDTAANRGNPALGAERADGSELGVAGHLHTQQWRASVFRRRNDALIDWTRLPGSPTWQAETFSGYRARGLELDWRWQPGLAWLDMLGVTWARTLVDIDTDGRPVTYARQVPSHVLGLHWRMPLANRLSFSVDARRPSYAGQSEVNLVSARIAWRGTHAHVALEGNNLFGERVVESGFASIPGRWIYLTAGLDY